MVSESSVNVIGALEVFEENRTPNDTVSSVPLGYNVDSELPDDVEL